MPVDCMQIMCFQLMLTVMKINVIKIVITLRYTKVQGGIQDQTQHLACGVCALESSSF